MSSHPVTHPPTTTIKHNQNREVRLIEDRQRGREHTWQNQQNGARPAVKQGPRTEMKERSREQVCKRGFAVTKTQRFRPGKRGMLLGFGWNGPPHSKIGCSQITKLTRCHWLCDLEQQSHQDPTNTIYTVGSGSEMACEIAKSCNPTRWRAILTTLPKTIKRNED